ncbi:unnamed protein product [Gulo gulo]|uniref:Uncharacterized protein n=1 Tax=Gulo gulo TaxID=48420 RepID=A0A9X9LF63_GULGU|nr:unnamed protein product [Gulo gulo]
MVFSCAYIEGNYCLQQRELEGLSPASCRILGKSKNSLDT